MNNKIPRSDEIREVDVDYKFRDDLPMADDETIRIELLKEPYAGVVYFYTGVGFHEDEEGTPHLRFGYHVIERPLDITDEMLDDVEFKTLLGDIVVSLFIEGSSKNEFGNDDPEEFDSERGIREESFTISED